jgi:hypothetical protein
MRRLPCHKKVERLIDKFVSNFIICRLVHTLLYICKPFMSCCSTLFCIRCCVIRYIIKTNSLPLPTSAPHLLNIFD